MVHAPPGVYWEWAGTFEQLRQVESRLLVIIPFTLLIIILLIYVNTRSLVKTGIVLLAVPGTATPTVVAGLGNLTGKVIIDLAFTLALG